MPRITHIVLKVVDIGKTSTFYETVFRFRHVNTVRHEGRMGNHNSRHLTDGVMDLTFINYEHENADHAHSRLMATFLGHTLLRQHGVPSQNSICTTIAQVIAPSPRRNRSAVTRRSFSQKWRDCKVHLAFTPAP